MTNNKNYSEEIRKNLFSGNTDIIEKTLNDIKQNGVIEIVPILLDFHLLQSNSEFKTKVFQIISDIKSNKVAEVLIDSLSKPKYKTIRKDIVSICWQSRFDYTKFLETFLDIFIFDELETSIEAYTVLEEIVPNLTMEERDRLRDALLDAMNDMDETKKALTSDLIASN